VPLGSATCDHVTIKQISSGTEPIGGSLVIGALERIMPFMQ